MSLISHRVGWLLQPQGTEGMSKEIYGSDTAGGKQKIIQKQEKHLKLHLPYQWFYLNQNLHLQVLPQI